MTAVLVALLTVLVLGVLLAACVVLLVVLPFVVSVDMAERRGFSPARWGALCLAVLAVAAVVGRRSWGSVLFVVPVALTWAVPGALALLDPTLTRFAGRQGAHER